MRIRFPRISIPILFFLFSSSNCVYSQKADSTPVKSMEEVIVTAYREKPSCNTSLNVFSLKMDSAGKYARYSLSEMLAEVPGIQLLSTGNGISKPVIRGLYGNRVLILMSGLKFDNQQWQEEHGLGISSMGFSRIEVIKGPVGTLYGSEAIGGVINLLEKEKPALNTQETEVNMAVNSNTLGGQVKAEYEVNRNGNWWSLRVGAENSADYSDGNGQRVLNSRFENYTIRSTYGIERKKITSTNNFLTSYNKAGFLFADIYTFVPPDNRWSRSMNEKPSHLVLLNILSSENKIKLPHGNVLNINAGIQSNRRMENESGGKVSLDMHLFTVQALAKLELKCNDKNKLIISSLHSFENNTNYGGRKIVPDANMQEDNISFYLESTIGRDLILENGTGAGIKFIHTFATTGLNTTGNEISPFRKFAPYYNFFSGITYFPQKKWQFKCNLASGVRVPNLAELSSNGLREGTYIYEIGKQGLRNEEVFSFNGMLRFQTDKIHFTFTPFANFFHNYIYLAPTAEQWLNFPIYRYLQQNVSQFGAELTGHYQISKKLSGNLSYAAMDSRTADGHYTPFTPAPKLVPALYYRNATNRKSPVELFMNLDCFFRQNHTAPNEILTPSYQLWNAGATIMLKKKEEEYLWSIAFHNILNTAYYDHLSRLKAFGLLNPGRNFSVNFRMKI